MESSLVTAESKGLLCESAYKKLGYSSALKEVWLIDDLLDLLAKANNNLPEGFQLLLWDGWRSDDLQGELWDQYKDEIEKDTGLQGKALWKKTQEFVSPPGVFKGIPAPHSTGATIDLTLADSNGNAIDMGGEFDELSDRTHPEYYNKVHLTEEETVFRDRRRILHRAQGKALFDSLLNGGILNMELIAGLILQVRNLFTSNL